jgi:hypothetical protein
MLSGNWADAIQLLLTQPSSKDGGMTRDPDNLHHGSDLLHFYLLSLMGED